MQGEVTKIQARYDLDVVKILERSALKHTHTHTHNEGTRFSRPEATKTQRWYVFFFFFFPLTVTTPPLPFPSPTTEGIRFSVLTATKTHRRYAIFCSLSCLEQLNAMKTQPRCGLSLSGRQESPNQGIRYSRPEGNKAPTKVCVIPVLRATKPQPRSALFPS